MASISLLAHDAPLRAATFKKKIFGIVSRDTQECDKVDTLYFNSTLCLLRYAAQIVELDVLLTV